MGGDAVGDPVQDGVELIPRASQVLLNPFALGDVAGDADYSPGVSLSIVMDALGREIGPRWPATGSTSS